MNIRTNLTLLKRHSSSFSSLLCASIFIRFFVVGFESRMPIFSGTPYYLWNGKSYSFQMWPVHSEFQRVYPNKRALKFLEKTERGRIQGLPNLFSGTPYYLTNGKSYRFQILPVHSEDPSEQNSIKNFVGKKAELSRR